MYGKKRIVLEKTGRISKCGGGSYHQIGWWNFSVSNKQEILACVLRPEHKWERKLTDETSITFVVKDKTELRSKLSALWF